MILVVFVLMIIYRLQTPNAELRHEQKIPWPYVVIAMGYIIMWAGLRNGYVDTAQYIINFENAPDSLNEAINIFSEEGKDKGFKFIEIVFKTFISQDFHCWLFFIALASGIPLMLAYRNHSKDYLYSIFLFITSTTVLWMFNGIRQFLVASILFGFGFLIAKRRLLPFILVLFICSFLHGSCLILLPVYFFVTDKPFGLKMLLFILGVLFIGFFIGLAMDTMETVLENTQYQGNLEEMEENKGVNPLRFLFSTIPPLLALIQRKKIAILNDKYLNMCVNMSTISAGFYFIAMLTSGIMVGRIPIYFCLYDYILLPYLFIRIYPRYKNLLYIGVSILFLIFYWYSKPKLYYWSDILGNYL